MIAFIEGQIISLEPGFAVLKTAGVGYQVMLSKKDYERVLIGQAAAFHVHSNIREDAFELYGFLHQADKQIFQMLISVSGVGPKLGLAIISALSSHDLLGAIIHKDLTKLSSINGIGKKTAERLCLELKDKALKLDLPYDSEKPTNLLSLMQAIRGLGYSKDQSDQAVAALDPEDILSLPLEILVKKTLAVLVGKSHDYN